MLWVDMKHANDKMDSLLRYTNFLKGPNIKGACHDVIEQLLVAGAVLDGIWRETTKRVEEYSGGRPYINSMTVTLWR